MADAGGHDALQVRSPVAGLRNYDRLRPPAGLAQPVQQIPQVVIANADRSRIDDQGVDIAAAYARQGDRSIPQPLHDRWRPDFGNALPGLFGQTRVAANYEDVNAVTH
jgi:hypothetical protein